MNKAVLTIHYTDGTTNRFVFERNTDEANALARLEEGLKAGVLLVQLAERVLMVPFASIKSVEITPVPVKLPRYALRNVRLLA